MIVLLFFLACLLFYLSLCVRSHRLYHTIPAHLRMVLAMFEDALTEENLAERYKKVRDSRLVLSTMVTIFTPETIYARCHLDIRILQDHMARVEETLLAP